MFTGIVSAIGRVAEARPGRLGIAQPKPAQRLARGGSVAVNGCCLTVTEVQGQAFFADVVPETLRRTNLGALRQGDHVNLELPLRLEQGLDGHLVQGHIDATARVLRLVELDRGREIEIEMPPEVSPFVAEKGSIAVDGISLTVATVSDGRFTVALIPHTLSHTIAGRYTGGSTVNLEVDVVARYVRRLAAEGTVTGEGRKQ